MIVQTYLPNKLSPRRYDAYLASGWFRGSIMLYKMDLLCLEHDVFSVVNIRLNIPRFKFKKRHLKLLRKNDNKFRTCIRKVSFSPEKERLYQLQKIRFKGFIHSNLKDYLCQGHLGTPFDTHEICVYHGDTLVALSLFDRGEKSIASLIGLQDPEFHKDSLGIYTMLKELEYAQNNGIRWYYPGYVLDKPSSFNYKLTLGEFEHYNTNKRWTSFSKFNKELSLANKFRKGMARMEDCLAFFAVEFDSILYPYFSMGYLDYWGIRFLKTPNFLTINTASDSELAVSFDVESNMYELLWISPSPSHDYLINMEMSNEFMDEKEYCLQLMEIEESIIISKNPSDLVEEISSITTRKGIWKRGNHLY